MASHQLIAETEDRKIFIVKPGHFLESLKMAWYVLRYPEKAPVLTIVDKDWANQHLKALSPLNADLAQTVERLSCKQDVAGSIPAVGSNLSMNEEKMSPESQTELDPLKAENRQLKQDYNGLLDMTVRILAGFSMTSHNQELSELVGKLQKQRKSL